MVAQTRHYATCLGIVEIGYLFELSAVGGDVCIDSERERQEECNQGAVKNELHGGCGVSDE